jgi:hypothetical protein
MYIPNTISTGVTERFSWFLLELEYLTCSLPPSVSSLPNLTFPDHSLSLFYYDIVLTTSAREALAASYWATPADRARLLDTATKKPGGLTHPAPVAAPPPPPLFPTRSESQTRRQQAMLAGARSILLGNARGEVIAARAPLSPAPGR